MSNRRSHRKRAQSDLRTKTNRNPWRVVYSEKSLQVSLLGSELALYSWSAAPTTEKVSVGVSMDFSGEGKIKI